MKAHDALTTIYAYRLLAKQLDERGTPYPLHLGVTEAGLPMDGTIKSSIGLGVLLFEGIGDTLRVSLAADPVEEVPVAWGILKALGLREKGFDITACPSCGRAEIEVVELRPHGRGYRQRVHGAGQSRCDGLCRQRPRRV